jgi:hypothetical protein
MALPWILRAPGSSPTREHHRAGEAAEETSAGHLIGYVVREIGHVVLHFLHLRKPSASEKTVKNRDIAADKRQH